MLRNKLAEDWSNSSFWQQKSLKEISELLWKPVTFNRELSSPLPKNDQLHSVLKLVMQRVEQLLDQELADDCVAFVRNTKYAHSYGVSGAEGERCLQIRAIANFYLGNNERAAQLAGILGDLYFVSHTSETDYQSGHFNKIAGIAYERCGHHENAVHHYHQFSSHTVGYPRSDEEAERVTRYLEEHHALRQRDEKADSAKAQDSLFEAAIIEFGLQQQSPEKKIDSLQKLCDEIDRLDQRRRACHWGPGDESSWIYLGSCLFAAQFAIKALGDDFHKDLSSGDAKMLQKLDGLFVTYQKKSGLASILQKSAEDKAEATQEMRRAFN